MAGDCLAGERRYLNRLVVDAGRHGGNGSFCAAHNHGNSLMDRCNRPFSEMALPKKERAGVTEIRLAKNKKRGSAPQNPFL